MPDQLNRLAPIVRLSALIAALLIATHVVIAPAAATPARDDDTLTVAPAPEEDEAAAEPAPEEDEAAAEPPADEDEAAAELPADDDEAAAEPAVEADEPAAESTPEEDEAAATPAPEEDEAAAPAHDERQAAVAPARVDDEVADLFLMRLLSAINRRRDNAGTQHLAFVPASANAALDGFLAETVPVIGWPGPCGHHLVDGAFSWDHVVAAGFGGAPRGEVLACPGPEPYWTPDRTAEQWWDSPIHHDVLYADGDSNSIACSAYGVRDGSNGGGKKKSKNSGAAEAASAVLCVTFRG